MIPKLITSVIEFIYNRPLEASATGLLITAFSKFIEVFNKLHIPDVIVPLLQSVMLILSIYLGIMGLLKNKRKNEKENG